MRNNFNELLSERLKEISKQENFNQLMSVLVEDLGNVLRFIIEELGNVLRFIIEELGDKNNGDSLSNR